MTATWTGVFCILGTRPSLVEGEVVGLRLWYSTKMFGVDALAVVDEGEGDGLVEVEERAVEDVFPGGVLDGVEVDDGVAGVDAGLGDGGVGGDVVGVGGAVDVLLRPRCGAWRRRS